MKKFWSGSRLIIIFLNIILIFSFSISESTCVVPNPFVINTTEQYCIVKSCGGISCFCGLETMYYPDVWYRDWTPYCAGPNNEAPWNCSIEAALEHGCLHVFEGSYDNNGNYLAPGTFSLICSETNCVDYGNGPSPFCSAIRLYWECWSKDTGGGGGEACPHAGEPGYYCPQHFHSRPWPLCDCVPDPTDPPPPPCHYSYWRTVDLIGQECIGSNVRLHFHEKLYRYDSLTFDVIEFHRGMDDCFIYGDSSRVTFLAPGTEIEQEVQLIPEDGGYYVELPANSQVYNYYAISFFSYYGTTELTGYDYYLAQACGPCNNFMLNSTSTDTLLQTMQNRFPFSLLWYIPALLSVEVSRPESISFDMGMFGIWEIPSEWYPYSLVRAFLLISVILGMTCFIIKKII